MSCLLMMEIKKENVRKKVSYVDDVKKHIETVMICAIDRTHFFIHKEHMGWRLQCIMSHHEQ